VVAANLLLTSQATPASRWATAGIGRFLSAWEGPGTLVLAGNVFDLQSMSSPGDDPDSLARHARGALAAHQSFADAVKSFATAEDRRVFCLPGQHDAALRTALGCAAVLEDLGVHVEDSLDLHLTTAAGIRRVRVEAGGPPSPDSAPGLLAPLDPSRGALSVRDATPPAGADTWQAGRERLVDPAALHRFLTSRMLYRRLARYTWWLALPFVVALILRLKLVSSALRDLFNVHPVSSPAISRAIARAHNATWEPRLLLAAGFMVIEALVLAAVVGWLSRKAWTALGGGPLARVFAVDPDAGATANDRARDNARALMRGGYTGLVTGATLQAELTDLGPGFFACTGVAGELVEEHPGRLGLPPVFLHHNQLAWVELETGADLHTRLLLARTDSSTESFLERFAARSQPAHDTHPLVVAAYPQGRSWPPAPDIGVALRRGRRIRRWSAGAIALTGVVDLVAALTPPLRDRLHLVESLLPLGATQAAGALVALAGIGLLALARGIRRGQHRAWAICLVLLAGTIVLHIIHGADIEASLFSGVVLLGLLTGRKEYRAASDRPSLRSAAQALVLGVVGITAITVLVTRFSLVFDRDRHTLHLSWWQTTQAVVERLVGIRNVALPHRLDMFLSPSLLAIGLSLAAVAVLLATRPVVDRHRTSGRAGEQHARDIVRRHGNGTLDYFALRSDKQIFFHRDSLVAYAIHNGICLVAPDPIGPNTEREQVWLAFRRFADEHGWIVAVMGAAEDWLPIYRATGMHDIYIGDEAVVDLDHFSLAGGTMKGLRQAFNRIERHGYTATFHDPARLDPATASQLVDLMSQGRRGEFERGFSMMLGRVFDPRDIGLLLCVVHGPDGRPAAMCQFVPASGIGGYSLDLMRRDLGEHPNGLIDFALVSTITHLREGGFHGLSLNFATLRSILEGDRGDGVTQRVERWALRKMSAFLQIETLWKFNAKYEPTWLPRYAVYDTAEHLVSVLLAIVKAESFDVPVIGRVLGGAARRAEDGQDTRGSAPPGEDGSSLLPTPTPVEH
jgi:lysylphosphatidylglycerol synthetase-like protein (DUF2156 family)